MSRLLMADAIGRSSVCTRPFSLVYTLVLLFVPVVIRFAKHIFYRPFIGFNSGFPGRSVEAAAGAGSATGKFSSIRWIRNRLVSPSTPQGSRVGIISFAPKKPKKKERCILPYLRGRCAILGVPKFSSGEVVGASTLTIALQLTLRHQN